MHMLLLLSKKLQLMCAIYFNGQYETQHAEAAAITAAATTAVDAAAVAAVAATTITTEKK